MTEVVRARAVAALLVGSVAACSQPPLASRASRLELARALGDHALREALVRL